MVEKVTKLKQKNKESKEKVKISENQIRDMEN